MRRSLLTAFVLLLAAVPVARAAAPAACDGAIEPPGDPLVVEGTFDGSLQGDTVLVPFDVPAGATRIHLRLCHDEPSGPLASQVNNTIDLGLYEPGDDGEWDTDQFRGWGGSSRPEVVLTPEDTTTVGYLPGPIPAGEWAAELGVAAVTAAHEGGSGSVSWRLEVSFGSDPADADDPWTPAPYDDTPAGGPGWYAGDFHVHARHSNPADAEMAQVFDYAFRPRPDGAGLDFITLSDYVSPRTWAEIGRFQGPGNFIGPDKLVVRSSEVITYRGHINNHASLNLVDHRTGAVHVLRDGELTTIRPPRPASAILGDIHASGTGWTQVNHPTIFPSQVPGFDNLCRGCSWSYTDEETDWSRVDAFEVQTGPAGYTDPEGNEPGPNPFTPAAIEWWDRLRRAGHRITAVGASDSHKADGQSLTTSPIGEATTVVRAPELSEAGIRAGILAGHAYVKFFSSDGPDLRFEATAADGTLAIMGDDVGASTATLRATVLGGLPTPSVPQPRVLVFVRDGLPVLSVPVAADPFTFELPVLGGGGWRLQLQRGSAIEALTNPITLTGD